MRRKLASAVLGLSLLAASLPAFAGPMLLDGNVTTNRVELLTSQIQWNRSLGQAEQTAAEQGKMVFWVHMLGSMSGAT